MLLEQRLTGISIGAFYDVYNELRFGFPEPVYRRGTHCELTARGLHVEEEHLIDVNYKGWKAGHFRANLFVARRLILEIEASRAYVLTAVQSHLIG